MSGFPPTGGFAVNGDGEAQDYEEWANTKFGPQIQAQAWSAGAQPPGPVNHRTHHLWWCVGGLIAVILVLAGVVINAVVATASQKDDLNSWPTGYVNPPSHGPASTTPDPPPPPAGPFVPNMNVAGQETRDGQFLQLLIAAGLDWSTRSEVIEGAHDTCAYMAAYNVGPEAMAVYVYTMHQTTPGWATLTMEESRAYVHAATTAYCPGLA